jgi:cytidylate kinase
MTPLLTIALDGPAASGKSTVAALVAQRLNFLYFDTGAMYRAITYAALVQNGDLGDHETMGALAQRTVIDIEPPLPDEQDGRQYSVRVDEVDVTWGLRESRVDQNVSTIAAHPMVREALKAQQRRIGLRGRVIMVGRDIGTVVLPEAPLKIYLDASMTERAWRRFRETSERGEDTDYDRILADMRSRDERDRHRATDPLRPADDAIIFESDGKSVAEVSDFIMEQARRVFGDALMA